MRRVAAYAPKAIILGQVPAARRFIHYLHRQLSSQISEHPAPAARHRDKRCRFFPCGQLIARRASVRC
jgi:hypothetical protein